MRAWTTTDLPTGEQFSYWREVVCEAFTPLAVERSGARRGRAPDEPGIASWVRSSVLSSTNCAEVTSRTQLITHGPAEVRRTRSDHLFVNFQLRGSCLGSQGGRSCVVPAGSFALFDTTSEYRLDFVGDEATQEWHVLSFRVPRAQLVPLLTAPHGFTAVTHDATVPGAANLVASTMAAIWQNIEQLDHDARHSTEMAFGAVLASALGDHVPPPESSRADIDNALRASIVRYLSVAVAQNRITAEDVATRFAISVRKLHQLFERSELSFGRTVAMLRLEGCARELTSAGGPSLAAIASRWGFSDQSHLSRAFRAHFGCTPSEYRDANGPRRQLEAPAAGARPESSSAQ